MNFEGELFKLGVGTWVMDVITQIPTTGESQFNIGQTLPKNVGYIYGLSTYCDGKDIQAVNLPTTLQLQNLYITLQNGPTQFFSQVRMSDFANELTDVASGSYQVRDQKYTPVNIPAFDLSTSYYSNPNLYTGPINIHLKLWFVQLNDWDNIKHLMSLKHEKEMKTLLADPVLKDSKLRSFVMDKHGLKK